jgi:hypothetical protein
MLKNKKALLTNKSNAIFTKLHHLFDEKTSETKVIPPTDSTIKETHTNNNNNNNYHVTVPNYDMNLKINPRKTIEVCIYQVYWHYATPFLLFLLNKKNETTLSFIDYINNGSTNAGKLKHNIIKYISQFFPIVNITYQGFYETAEKNVIILNYEDQYNYNSIITTEKNSYLWSTVYEIINVNKVYNYHLDSNITNFFKNNPDFLRISQSSNGLIYETPLIGYYKTKKTDSIDEVDIYRETIIPALPKSYYLYSAGCIPQITDEITSLLRIVIFKGKLAFKDIVLYNNDPSYDTLFCIYKNVNRYYIIRNYSQHTILSIL